MEDILLENSIYTTTAEKDAILADKEKVMNLMIFNLFIFLGLLKMDDTTAGMRNYETAEGKLQIQSIGDNNHDASLSVKLAHDSGLITPTVTAKITKMLYLIKTKKITSATLDEEVVRSLLDEIKYQTHKPSPQVFSIVSKFHDKTLDLKHFAKELYNLSKRVPNKEGTLEVRELVMKGKYNTTFGEMEKALNGVAATPPVAGGHVANPHLPNPAGAVNKTSVKTVVDPVKSFSSFAKVTPGEVTRELIDLVLSAKDKDEIKAILKSSNVKQYQIPDLDDGDDFKHIVGFALRNVVQRHDPISEASIRMFSRSQLDSLVELYMQSWFKDFDALPVSVSHEKSLSSILTVVANVKLIAKQLSFTDYLHDITYTKDELFKKLVGANQNDSVIFASRIVGVHRLVSVFNISYERLLPTDVYNTLTMRNSNVGGVLAALYKYIISLDHVAPALKTLQNLAVPMDMFQNIITTIIDGRSGDLPIKIGSGIDRTFKVFKDTIQLLPVELQAVLGTFKPNKFLEIVEPIGGEDLAKQTLDYLCFGAAGDFYTTTLFNLYEKSISDADNKAFVKNYIKGLDRKAFDTILDNVLDYSRITDKSERVTRTVINELLLSDYITLLSPTKLSKILRIMRISLKYTTQDIESLFSKMSKSTIVLLIAHANDLYSDTGNLLIKEYISRKYLSSHTIAYSILTEFDIMLFNDLEIYSDVKDIDHMGVLFKKLTSSYRNVSNESAILSWINKMCEAFPKQMEQSALQFINDFGSASGLYMTNIYALSCLKHISAEALEKLAKTIAENKVPSAPQHLANFGLVPGLREAISKQIIDKPPVIGKLDTAIKSIYFLPPDELKKYTDSEIGFADWGGVEAIIYATNARLSAGGSIDKHLVSWITKQFEGSFVTGYKSKAFKDTIKTTFSDLIKKIVLSESTDVIEELFLTTPPTSKKVIIDAVVDARFIGKALEKVKSGVIKPLISVDKQRMVQVLKYNNINIPAIRSNSTKTKTIKDLIEYINQYAEELKDLEVKQVMKTDKELMQSSVEYDAFNKYKHGSIAVKFLKEFDVNIPTQATGFQEFLAAKPTSDVMDPVFHGTGSIAASMILRYGFTVIKSSDASVVGRMLGDGVYFSNVLDKVAQYVSDGGYSRGHGSKGYIFQMKAALGDNKVDYRSAGTGGDHIVSPEWCVFDEKRQLIIYKAYMIELISKKEMDAIKAEHGKVNESVIEVKSFTQFIKEAAGEYTNATTYVFVDGNIPLSKDEAVDFEEFDASQYGDHVRMEPSANGPLITISHNEEESNAFCVRSTGEFMQDEQELNRFLDMLKGK